MLLIFLKRTKSLKREVKMYFEQAIARINNIDWDRVGTIVSKKDGDLGIEFLERLADFYSETALKPYPPLVSDIAMLMGAHNEENFEPYYTEKTKKFLNITLYQNKIIEYYLKLAQLADDVPETGKYIHVYEPLINIFERGGSYKLRARDLEIENVIFIPLYHWYEKFKSKER